MSSLTSELGLRKRPFYYGTFCRNAVRDPANYCFTSK